MKRFGLATVALLLAVIAVVVVRGTRAAPPALPAEKLAPLAVDAAAAAEHLAALLRFETVSKQDGAPDLATFDRLRGMLEATYAKLHAALVHERAGEDGGSLLYTWKGSDPTAKPLLFMAHLDVVPVEPGIAWTEPPFAGKIAGGFVWGRGALDDKSSVIGLCEAVEALLATGYAPRRTIYLAFGHDEEVGGRRGASRMAALLESRGVKPELVLDEGLFIVHGVLEGAPAPVAMIGIAEKGYASVELLVESAGGHSSMPPPETAVGILAGALSRLEHAQMPTRLAGAPRQLFETVAPFMPAWKRLVLTNLWLFSPMVQRSLAGKPTTNALVRTTTAPTILEGSVKDNVLATRARAAVNFRILPGDSVAGVVAHVNAAVNDNRVRVTLLQTTVSEPSPQASTESAGYSSIVQAIHQTFPDVLVAPGLMVAATDSRHMRVLGADTYRFAPHVLAAEDLKRIHGTDERIALTDLEQGIRFYAQVIRNADAATR